MDEQIDSVTRLVGDAMVIDQYGTMLLTEIRAYTATRSEHHKYLVKERIRLIRQFLAEIEPLLEE